MHALFRRALCWTYAAGSLAAATLAAKPPTTGTLVARTPAARAWPSPVTMGIGGGAHVLRRWGSREGSRTVWQPLPLCFHGGALCFFIFFLSQDNRRLDAGSVEARRSAADDKPQTIPQRRALQHECRRAGGERHRHAAGHIPHRQQLGEDGRVVENAERAQLVGTTSPPSPRRRPGTRTKAQSGKSLVSFFCRPTRTKAQSGKSLVSFFCRPQESHSQPSWRRGLGIMQRFGQQVDPSRCTTLAPVPRLLVSDWPRDRFCAERARLPKRCTAVCVWKLDLTAPRLNALWRTPPSAVARAGPPRPARESLRPQS